MAISKYEAERAEKEWVIARLKAFVEDGDVTWRHPEWGLGELGQEVARGGGTVQVVFHEERTGSGYHVKRSGRFGIVVKPECGDYSRNAAATTRFRPRKEGWTDARLREVSATIVNGLARSASALADVAGAASVEAAAWKRIEAEKVQEGGPCKVSVERDTDAVRFLVNMSDLDLTLDQAIAIARFVNNAVFGSAS